MSKLAKVVVIREFKTGPTQFQAEVERLKAAGRLPSLEEVLAAVRKIYAPLILAARRKPRKR
jgi:hypothetical protein